MRIGGALRFPALFPRGGSLSAPVRGHVASEAGVIGAGTTGSRGVQPLCGAAEGVVLVVRPCQILGALTARHTLLVPG